METELLIHPVQFFMEGTLLTDILCGDYSFITSLKLNEYFI